MTNSNEMKRSDCPVGICTNTSCRMWINYLEDNNCGLLSIDKNGAMTNKEIAARLGVSAQYVSSVEQRALRKLMAYYYETGQVPEDFLVRLLKS